MKIIAKIKEMKDFYNYETILQKDSYSLSSAANMCVDEKGNLYMCSSTAKEIYIFNDLLEQVGSFSLNIFPTNIGAYGKHIVVSNRYEREIVLCSMHNSSWHVQEINVPHIESPVVFEIGYARSCIVDLTRASIYSFDERNGSLVIAQSPLTLSEESFDPNNGRPFLRRLGLHEEQLYSTQDGCLVRINADGRLKKLFSFPVDLRQISGMVFLGNRLCLVDSEKNCILVMLVRNESMEKYKVIVSEDDSYLFGRICSGGNFLYVYRECADRSGNILKMQV